MLIKMTLSSVAIVYIGFKSIISVEYFLAVLSLKKYVPVHADL